MAKVYKVTMYLTDVNGYLNYSSGDKELLEYELNEALERLDMITHYADIKESEEFNWDDDLRINNLDATTDDYEKYFKCGMRVHPLEGNVTGNKNDTDYGEPMGTKL